MEELGSMEENIKKQIEDLKKEMRQVSPFERLLLIPELRKLCEIRDNLIKERVNA